MMHGKQNVKFYTDSLQTAKYSDKITRSYWPSKESYYALQSMELLHYRWNFL